MDRSQLGQSSQKAHLRKSGTLRKVQVGHDDESSSWNEHVMDVSRK